MNRGKRKTQGISSTYGHTDRRAGLGSGSLHKNPSLCFLTEGPRMKDKMRWQEGVLRRPVLKEKERICIMRVS